MFNALTNTIGKEVVKDILYRYRNIDNNIEQF